MRAIAPARWRERSVMSKRSSPRRPAGRTSQSKPATTAPGGANALMGDGSVRFVKSTIDGMVWRELGTVAGGELISSDSY
jgi:prepilin-type processing-associated H-X9-DG protein